MSRYYRNVEEQKGYDAWNDRFNGKSYYDGDYDYQNGWEEHRREVARELDRKEEEQRLREEEERIYTQRQQQQEPEEPEEPYE